MVLIRIGGLGVVTETPAAVALIGGEPSYGELLPADEEGNLPGGPRNLELLFGRIVLFILVVELAGTPVPAALAVVFLLVVLQARGGGKLVAFGRRIPDHFLRKTLALVPVAALLLLSGAVAMTLSEGWESLPALFHPTSVLGTVGLGPPLLILLMLVGGAGLINFLVALSSRSGSFPPGSIPVG